MISSKGIVSFGLVVLVGILLLSGCGSKSSSSGPPPPLMVVTTQLPPAVQGLGYRGQLNASGGSGTYTWALAPGGSLPDGLSLGSSNGQITGTPTPFGQYTIGVQVTDSKGAVATGNPTLYIEGTVSVSAPVAPSGSIHLPYNLTLTATGGLQPYTWCVLGSNGQCDSTQAGLPAGLSLDTKTGVISGTPTTDGPPTSFTVQAGDAEMIPATGSVHLTITVIDVVTTSLPAATVNKPYNTSVTVAGGQGPYSWAISSGTLPPGLSLNPSCLSNKGTSCQISGTPTQLGVYPLTFQVSDGEKPNPAVGTSMGLQIVVQFVITPTQLPTGNIGIPYSVTMQASGGTGPYTWSIISGGLPQGLSLNANTGEISGTPSGTPGTSAFTVQATDSVGNIATSFLGILINPGVSNANLNGNYAFTCSGYKGGNLVVMAGAFKADGKGDLSGELDYNDGSGETININHQPTQHIIQPSPNSGYSIDPTSGLGTMTFLTDLGRFNFHIAITGNGSGSLSLDNDSGQYGSGQILLQNPSDFIITALDGTFAVGFSGTDNQSPAQRYAGAGAFDILDHNGDIDCNKYNNPPACPADVNDGGTLPATTFRGTFSTSIDTLGRGAATNLTFNSDHTHVFVYAYYVVNHNQLIQVAANPIKTTDPYTLTLWSIRRQFTSGTGFSNTALNGPVVVQDTALTSGAPDVSAGLLSAQGAGGHTCQSGNNDPLTFNYDENQGGTASLQQTWSGLYCVDKTSGRVTLSKKTADFATNLPVFYMIASGQGFVVGTDPGVTTGYFEPQTGSPFSNISIIGNYTGGTILPAAAAVNNAVDSLFSDANGNITGTQDFSGSGGVGQTNLSFTYATDSSGRTTVQNNSQTVGILYVISPTKSVYLPMRSNDGSQPEADPVLSIFNALSLGSGG